MTSNHGITNHRLPHVVTQIKTGKGPVSSASSADFFDLITLGATTREDEPA